jgi:DmsE family decaheme c-type cytochrome
MRNFGRMPLSSLLLRLGCAFALLISYPGQSAQAVDSPDSRSDVPQSAPASVSAVEYSKKGADTCIKCHDEASKFPVFAIFKTRHAMKGDPRTPFAGLQCEACHGPAGSHVDRVKPGEKRPPILNFGEKSAAPAEAQNRMCLQCHQDANHIGWKGSPHEAGQVSCASCHTIHAAHDPVLDRVTQPDVCFKCHLKERAEFFKPSNHPVRFGQLDCSDCHETHGAGTSMLLTRPTLNETCYTCHADKRGPFLWEHAPVAEDCSLCHTPHGSINPALLTKRPPLLCQQCHSQLGHPSVAYTTQGLPDANPSGFLLAGSCMNCHSQVHGSNSPSGVKLMR